MRDAGNNICKGIHHVAFRACDLDTSVKFYTEGLGFKKHLAWSRADFSAVLLDTGNGSYFEIFNGGSKDTPEGIWAHVALLTENCDLAIEQARNAGAIITKEPTDVSINANDGSVTAIRIAFCKGPDGELIEFYQYR